MSKSAQAPNRHCQTCGTPYYFCNCHHNADKFHWKMNCCTPQHFQIFMTALDLRDGMIDAKEAKTCLKRIGFNKSDLRWCTEPIAGILASVFEQKKTEQKQDVEEGE